MRLPPYLAVPCGVVLLALLCACARLPAEEARGSPVEAVAARSFALLSLHGMPLGSAVALAPGLLVTSAHVVPPGADRLAFTRGDGAMGGEAVLVGRSQRMDLAVLAVPPGFLAPVSSAPDAPRPGQRLWAVGAPAAGSALAEGQVVSAAAWLADHGTGFIARMPALFGYSGGPAVDGEGRLVGIVTALTQPGVAPLLVAFSGLDLDGLARGSAGREVFLLGAAAVTEEARRIEGRAGPPQVSVPRGAAPM
jgi:S1-C subfamily serine protease